MDSGVFILNFSTCRKVLSLLKFRTGLHLGEAWVLETGNCKTPRDFTFSTLSITFFDSRDWMQWGKAWSFGRALYSDIIREKLTKLGFERNGST